MATSIYDGEAYEHECEPESKGCDFCGDERGALAYVSVGPDHAYLCRDCALREAQAAAEDRRRAEAARQGDLFAYAVALAVHQ